MGLDMTLYARKYVPEYDFKKGDTGIEQVLNPNYQALADLIGDGADNLVSFKGAHVEVEIGYWRKVNQVHGWFVDNCADGVDNCQDVYVSADDLQKLRAIITDLLDNRNAEDILDQIEQKLPLADGFFFGSREIDEYYWEGLEESIPILDHAIRLAEEPNMSICYRASW